MYCIVGLGNPGKEYAKTRHNVGWILMDQLFKDASWKGESSAQADFANVTIAENQVELLKPQTFMNNSGMSVAYAIKKHSLTNNQIIVMHDEVDLPLGTIKLSFDRGDAGHNGIKSITEHLHGNNYYRLRIGISQTIENNPADSETEFAGKRVVKPNVLGDFQEDELKVIENLVQKVKQALEIFMTKGYEKAATFLHS